MAGGFTKLFSDILDSTIWREDMPTKIVWITMLARADRHGIVSASLPGLADLARVTLPQCQEALQKFLGPDEYSRTKDFDGKRIMETDGGWILLNYQKYRKIQDAEEVRIATAERVRKFREKHKVTNVTDVTLGNAIAEAEAEAEASTTPLTPLKGGKGTGKGGRAKGKPESIGEYPPELHEASAAYKAMMRECHHPSVYEQFPPDKRFLAKGAGPNEGVWKAWQGRTGVMCRGSVVTDQDVLAAVLKMARRKRKQAVEGKSLAIPMLTTLINSDDFVDVLTIVKEVSHAS